MSGRREQTAAKADRLRRYVVMNQGRGKASSSLAPSSPSVVVSPPPHHVEARRPLTPGEAREHIHNNWPLPSDCRLPDGWVTNIVRVSMAPELSGEVRLAYIKRSREAMSWELHHGLMYTMYLPY